eukprot:gene17534-19975_t
MVQDLDFTPDFERMLKQISVIGGGLGGLAFAQGMRLLAGYQVVVYERDTSPSHRSQGYQIGLNSDGLGALNMLSLPGFPELIHENPLYGFMMTDHQLEGLVRFPVQKVGTQPTKMSLVNRFRLRDILATGITIQWDKKFVKYLETPEGVVAHFEDGSTAVLDLTLCSSITDEAIEELSSCCPLLASLNITHCTHISDDSLRALALHCHELRELVLSFCSG